MNIYGSCHRPSDLVSIAIFSKTKKFYEGKKEKDKRGKMQKCQKRVYKNNLRKYFQHKKI